MKTGSLISSLFRENSFSNRSAFMFQNSLSPIQNTLHRVRSQSACYDQIHHSAGGATTYRCLTLGKMVNTLARKVQKENYFFFVKLQTNLTKYRIENLHFQSEVPPFQKCSKIVSAVKYKTGCEKLQNIKKGVEKVTQIVDLNELKYRNINTKQFAFRKLQNQNKKFSAIESLVGFLSKSEHKNKHHSLKIIQNYQKYLLNTQIFLSVLINIFSPKLKHIFTAIKDCPNKSKLKKQLQQKQKKQKSKFIDVTFFQLPTVNSRLIAIKEENSSSIISEEDNSKFITPLKNHYNSHDLVFDDDENDLKAELKLQQLRSGFLNKKNILRDSDFPEDDSSYDTYSLAKKSCEHSNTEKPQIYFKPTTKIQPQKSKINLGNPYSIATLLEDTNFIIFKKVTKNNENQYMFKHNRLYSQSLIEPLPDLHDHMGVFEHLWSEDDNPYSEDCLLTQRNVEKSNKKCHSIQNKRKVRLSKPKRKDDEYQHVKTEQKQINQPEINYSNLTKQSYDYIGMGQHIKSMPYCQTMHKYNMDPINNKNNYVRGSLIRQNVNEKVHFCSSPLNKIEEMMMDLEKLRERQKFTCNKHSSAYQKCKISINLPSRKNSEQKYCQDISNKNQYISSALNSNSPATSKKQQTERYQTKEFLISKQNNEPKDNIQYKLLSNDKNKHNALYHDIKSNQNSKEKKNATITENQINTARKMKREIQNIINNRKNIVSFGDIKLGRSKY